jgi:hypothetical protein
LADPPRKSPVIQAELLFLDGIYIFHHRDKEIADAHIYKCISPAALRNEYDFEALGCFRLPAPTIQQPDLLVSQPEELADNNLSCEQMALLNSQSLSINQRVGAEAFDYLLQLTTGKLRRFATYFDLESGSGKSLYTTQASIMQAILLGHSCA